MDQFWLKYIFRVAHISGLIVLCHKTFSDFKDGFVTSDNALFYTIFGLMTIISGFVNTYLLKPEKMGEKRKAWVGFHHFKLAVTTLLYLPVAKWFLSSSALASIRMYWVLILIFISPFMRFYREYHASNQEKNRI